jgi:murein DD-endopeptidase MepM/ murein hydrolase activator NlpD
MKFAAGYAIVFMIGIAIGAGLKLGPMRERQAGAHPLGQMAHAAHAAPVIAQAPARLDSAGTVSGATLTEPVAPEAAPEAESPTPVAAPAPPADATGLRPLLIPVSGVSAARLVDNFDETHNGHKHEALDIMAATGTPVLAVDDGWIVKLFHSVAGGTTIYQFDPGRQIAYYYAHLDHYASGVVEGKAVSRGDVIAYVGHTGNAVESAPHLHFAMFRLGPEKRWWEGTAIDPYSLLTATPPP